MPSLFFRKDNVTMEETYDNRHCKNFTRRRTAKPGEVCAYYIEALGKYGACQVIDANQNSILHGNCKEAAKPKAVLTLEELWNAMDEVRGDW